MRFVFFLLLFLVVSGEAAAQSSYVLPYPSNMPGSYFYKIDQVKEKVLFFWYFGDFGQFKYNLKFTDKYLVEAKTLFEYKQYLLAEDALDKSDRYFKNTKPHLLRAEKNNKNISEKSKLLKEVSAKHIEILERIRDEVPEQFTWEPEKSEPINLKLRKEINESISIREKYQ